MSRAKIEIQNPGLYCNGSTKWMCFKEDNQTTLNKEGLVQRIEGLKEMRSTRSRSNQIRVQWIAQMK